MISIQINYSLIFFLRYAVSRVQIMATLLGERVIPFSCQDCVCPKFVLIKSPKIAINK